VVFKGADHHLPAFTRIHTRIISARQRRADVLPCPWQSPCGPARVFYRCSTSDSLWTKPPVTTAAYSVRTSRGRCFRRVPVMMQTFPASLPAITVTSLPRESCSCRGDGTAPPSRYRWTCPYPPSR